MITILCILVRVRFGEGLPLFVFMESGKADLSLFLPCLSISFGLDSIESHLICIVVLDLWFVSIPVGTSRATADATSAKAVETSCKEQEEPCGECEPDTDSDGCRPSLDGIDASLCDEEEDEIKNESDHGDDCSKARDTSAAACHGKLSDMGEQTEDG